MTTITEIDAEEAPLTIDDEQRLALIKRTVGSGMAGEDSRKVKARERLSIYHEKYGTLIYARLYTILNDEKFRDEVTKHIDVSENPALDALHDTCVVWSQGAKRTIAGATDSEKAAFDKLVAESKLDVIAPALNRLAEFVGPVIVIPAIKRKKLRWDVILPTTYDVEADPEDETGPPLAAAWPLRGGKQAVVLDAEGWHFYSTTPGGITRGDTRPHGLGQFPGVPLRFDEQIEAPDWYGVPTRHQRFVDATIAVGAINSLLSLNRKAQNSKLLTVIGYLGDVVREQAMDTETGIEINVDLAPGKQPPTVQALDYDTPPDNSITHANDVRRRVAAAYGGTVDEKGRMVFDADALTEIRRGQIPRAMDFERELWVSAIAMCKAMRHPMAAELPDPEKVRNGFSVAFGKLTRKFGDPKNERDHVDWLVSKGAMTQLDILREQGNESLDEEQLQATIEINLERQAWFNDAVTKRNLSMVAGNAATAPQAFGALGPMVRDAQQQTAPEGADEPEG